MGKDGSKKSAYHVIDGSGESQEIIARAVNVENGVLTFYGKGGSVIAQFNEWQSFAALNKTRREEPHPAAGLVEQSLQQIVDGKSVDASVPMPPQFGRQEPS